jgi:hypothetical protein
MKENKENLKMDRKRFLSSIAVIGAGFFFFRNIFNFFSKDEVENSGNGQRVAGKKSASKPKIQVKENPNSVKRQTSGGMNERV